MSSEERITAPFPSSFDRDLENARVLIEEPPWKDNPQKYRKVAEGILRRILSFDPANESAKRLLAKTVETIETVEIPLPAAEPENPLPRANVTNIDVRLSAPKPEPPPAPVKIRVSPPEPPASHRVVTPPEFSFVVDNARPAVQKEHPSRPPWLLVAFATLGAIAGVTLLVTHRNGFTSEYPPKAPIASPTVVQASTAVVPAVAVEPSNSTAVPEQPVPPSVPADPAPRLEVAPPQPTVVVKSNIPPVAPIQTGTLAVSSPTTVDIYMGGQLVGSAPTTLVLPAGNQTLEYRHQEMSKVVTHVIKANDTTTAMVTFDTVVQINARPWAQVFVDGTQRRPLGQTPLSDVLVPIGTVLVFENPNFPGKSYRITGKETQIRVNFP